MSPSDGPPPVLKTMPPGGEAARLWRFARKVFSPLCGQPRHVSCFVLSSPFRRLLGSTFIPWMQRAGPRHDDRGVSSAPGATNAAWCLESPLIRALRGPQIVR